MRTYVVKEDGPFNGLSYPDTINICTTNNKQEAIKVMEEKYDRWTVVYDEDGEVIGAMDSTI